MTKIAIFQTAEIALKIFCDSESNIDTIWYLLWTFCQFDPVLLKFHDLKLSYFKVSKCKAISQNSAIPWARQIFFAREVL